MSQPKLSQPKNSAQISKALADHQKAKAIAELEKLKKAQNDQSRADRLENRQKSSLPTIIANTPEPTKPPKSSQSSLNIRTPSPSPFDPTRFQINVTPTFDVKFDDKNHEPSENRDGERIEQPIAIVIDQPESDGDAEQDDRTTDKKDINTDAEIIKEQNTRHETDDDDDDEDEFIDTNDKTEQKDELNRDGDRNIDYNNQDDVFLLTI